MPIVEAVTYVAGILQGMTPPGQTGVKGPINAFITPRDPDVNPGGPARAYVWPAKGPEKRVAMPRNSGKGTLAGWKSLTHSVEIFLVWMDTPNDANADINFPLFIDWVMDILRTSANPVQVTDPNSGVVCDFANVGEEMTYDYVPPRTLENQRDRRYDARVSCTLYELFQR